MTTKDEKEATRMDSSPQLAEQRATAPAAFRDSHGKHRYEDAAMEIVLAIRHEFLPAMDTNDGGEILSALTALCERVALWERSKALTDVHEQWEFGSTSEDDFNAWMHEQIMATRAAIAKAEGR
jgi:hypothetical protein